MAPVAASRRPCWVSSHVPELDGLRGIAILSVVIYHCHHLLNGTGLDKLAQWGWAGVNLFFVLSGYLITGIIVDSRDDARFFTNFYARRALRIWPVYVFLLLAAYGIIPLVFGSRHIAWSEFTAAPWIFLLLFIQNLTTLSLNGMVGPTWSLAIEEQFYVIWAPIGRILRNKWLLVIAASILVVSPFLRLYLQTHTTPTHTLLHLDGLATGALIAAGIRTLPFSRRQWQVTSWIVAIVAGAMAIRLLWVGSKFSDSMLALLFGSWLLSALTTSGTKSLNTKFLCLPPLAFYGRISYGLYMTHILTFVVLGCFDLHMEKHGIPGNLAIFVVRFVLSTLVAMGLWYGFEQPILTLKRKFAAKNKYQQVPTEIPALAPAAE